ncbi:MAG: major royal jelly protein [Rhizobacter sp.]|nr:major royal jelly protein [Rhizobacter sp.]
MPEISTGGVDTAHVPSPLELVVGAWAPTTPTGMTVSHTGRLFIFMPRFDDKTKFVVGEVAVDGKVTPFPDAATNTPDTQRPQDTFFHVPNGVIDGKDRLWLLDAGLLGEPGPPTPGAPKLVCIDLATDRIVQTVLLGAAVEPTSSLNDLRVESSRGRGEMAFITDQGQNGKGAIIAVDLASGRCVRRLLQHSSTASQKGVVKIVEGEQVLKRTPEGVKSEVQGGANGIALSPDNQRLYYAPLMGRRLYTVSVEALLDPLASDAAVGATVKDLGEKGLTGGIITDASDRLYLSMQELNAIARRDADGTITLVARDDRLVWPDTFWITKDQWLYLSATQVNRRGQYHGGQDRQKPPYAILRMKIDAGPV